MKAIAALALGAMVCPSAWARPAGHAGEFLIETAPGNAHWVSEAEKMRMIAEQADFFDLTNEPDQRMSSISSSTSRARFPSQLSFVSEAKPLTGQLSSSNMRANLVKLSSYHTRYYKSETGLQAGNWLFERISEVVRSSGATNVSVKKFKHQQFEQQSIIVTIPGKKKDTVVVGAHFDSINQKQPSTGIAPGADDNGSGTVTILDSLRVLLSSPKIARGEATNTIEFHWYAAEEVGLLGSQDIFRSYKAGGKPVKAMLNQDMTGYTKGRKDAGLPEAFGVVTDNVDASLTAFTKLVIKGYTNVLITEDPCGYACSDHSSATRNGFPSAYVFEADEKHYHLSIHTPQDSMNLVDINHMVNHAKVIVGWVFELANANL